MTQRKNITVETLVRAPIEKVWECWTRPEHITQWNQASDDWHSPRAENDLRVGGNFLVRMEAKDKSSGFDFSGTYTVVEHQERIEYDMDDNRHVSVEFRETPEGVHVKETFDLENTHSEEMQRSGWQAILDNFRKYTELKVNK